MLDANEIAELQDLWDKQLRSTATTLVIQVEYEDQDARDAFLHIGSLLVSKDITFVKVYYSACFLVGINCVTSSDLNEGTLWPKIFAALGDIPDTPRMRTLISDLHSYLLDKYDLARFEHPLRLIGEMQLHAGVPVHSQAKFITKLLKAYSEIPDLNGASFNTVVRNISTDDVAAKGLDKPIWRFIDSAGDVADDFVDKCIDLLDDLQDDGIRNSGGGSGLPTRVISEIERLVKLGGRLIRSKSTALRLQSPGIRWDYVQTDNELHVELTNLSDKIRTEIYWQLDDQNDVMGLKTYPSLVPGLASRKEFFMLKTATPQVYLEAIPEQEHPLLTKSPSWMLKLYSDENPMLMFDHAGYLVDQAKRRLDPGQYTVLFPKSASSSGDNSLSIVGEHQIAEIDGPNGWNGWAGFRLDLNEAKSISLFGGTKEYGDTRKVISTVRRPKFVVETAKVESVYSESGLQVFSSLPMVEIPDTFDSETPWTFTVRDPERRLVWRCDFETGEGGLYALDQLDPPDFDGIYEVVLEQPGFGGSLRQEIALVTGLEATLSQSFRKLLSTSDGLEEIDVQLDRDGTSEEYRLNKLEPGKIVHSGSISRIPLVVRPPYESIELFNRKSGRRSEWIKTSRFHLEDLVDLDLSYRGESSSNRNLIAYWGNVHTVTLAANASSNRLRYSLGQLVDDAAKFGSFEVKIVDLAGNLQVVAGKCLPKTLHQGFTFQNDKQTLTVNFNNGLVPPDLKAAFYPATAAWLPHSVVDVYSDQVQVPPEISKNGDFIVALAISDVWVPHEFPVEPSLGDNTFLVENDLQLDVDEPESALVWWIESGERNSAIDSLLVETLWACLTCERVIGSVSQDSEVRRYALDRLAENPTEAFHALPPSHKLPNDYLRLFMKLGLAVIPSISKIDSLQSTTSKPAFGVLMTAGKDHGDLGNVMEWARSGLGLVLAPKSNLESEPTEIPPDKVIESKVKDLSFVIPETLRIHPFANPVEDLNEFGERNALVPGRFFERGTMFAGFSGILNNSMDLAGIFKVGMIKAYLDEIREYENLLPESYGLLAQFRPFATAEVLAEYKTIGGARSNIIELPALSIRLSMLARFYARGDFTAKLLWNRFEVVFYDLCQRAPFLVEHDLVLSELYISLSEGEKKWQQLTP